MPSEEDKNEVRELVQKLASFRDEDQQRTTALEKFNTATDALNSELNLLRGEMESIGNNAKTEITKLKENCASIREFNSAEIRRAVVQGLRTQGASSFLPVSMKEMSRLTESLKSLAGSEELGEPPESAAEDNAGPHREEILQGLKNLVLNRTIQLEDTIEETIGAIEGFPDGVFNSGREIIEQNIDELTSAIDDKISVAEDAAGGLSEKLDGAIESVTQLIESLNEMFSELADSWQAANDDMPEAQGTLGRVAGAIEDTKAIIDEVLDMI